jgi:hypothetical protein
LNREKMKVGIEAPGIAGVPALEITCLASFVLYSFAFSTLAPTSSSSPFDGHPLSDTTTAMLPNPSAFIA